MARPLGGYLADRFGGAKVTLFAFGGMAGAAAVAGSWITVIPPASATRRSPSAPSSLEPVSTTPTVAVVADIREQVSELNAAIRDRLKGMFAAALAEG